MEFFEYRADILPKITFSGRQEQPELWKNIRRISNDYIFYFAMEGDIYLVEDGVSYHFKKGDCMLLEPGKLHYGTQLSSCRFYYIHFTHPEIAKVTLEENQWAKRIENNHSAWRTSLEGGPFPENKISICKYFHVDENAAFTNICNMFEQMLNRQNVHLEHFDTLCACMLSEIFIELKRQYAITLFKNVACGAEKTERINAVLLFLNTNYKRKLQ